METSGIDTTCHQTGNYNILVTSRGIITCKKYNSRDTVRNEEQETHQEMRQRMQTFFTMTSYTYYKIRKLRCNLSRRLQKFRHGKIRLAV